MGTPFLGWNLAALSNGIFSDFSRDVFKYGVIFIQFN
eukprot:COSAG02_NODE_55489_length_290_cov_0.816754_1_plen_36_part_01